MMKWLTSCLLTRQRRTKRRQKKTRLRLRHSLTTLLFSVTRCAILVLPQTQTIAGKKTDSRENRLLAKLSEFKSYQI